ncbi:MAG: glycosyltransferase [Acidobacteriota bacterium]
MRLVLPRGANSDVTRFFEPYGVKIEYLDRMYAQHAAASLLDKLKRQWERIRSELEVYRYSRRNLAPNSIVHIEAAPWQSWILLYLLSRRFNTIATVHNSIPAKDSTSRAPIWSWRMTFLLRQPRFQLFAANQDAVESIRSYVPEAYWDKISLTRAAINPFEIEQVLNAPFDRDGLLRKHGVPINRFIVLCVGQFIDRKGRWVFMEAAQQARAAGNDLFFIWLGPEELSDADIARIAEYDVEGYFRYVVSPSLGPKRSDVLTFFRVADVFILASYLEGLPISIIEALALGLPVISTNINAIPEAVTNLKTGLLIKPGYTLGLTEAIEKFHLDDKFRTEVSKAGQAFALETFDERLATAVVFDRYSRGLADA